MECSVLPCRPGEKREEGREGVREGGSEGEREGEREGGREGVREGRSERGRERARMYLCVCESGDHSILDVYCPSVWLLVLVMAQLGCGQWPTQVVSRLLKAIATLS